MLKEIIAKADDSVLYAYIMPQTLKVEWQDAI
jgi:hypothetical protein